MSKTPCPFRYVGGKTRIYPTIVKYLPDCEEVNRYFEPFCGGAAVFFHYGYLCPEAYLNDICQPLMNAYSFLAGGQGGYRVGGVRENGLQPMADELHTLMEFSYEDIRAEFNNLRAQGDGKVYGLRGAALFAALNHLCFNGVWRENKKGEFNVPVGKNSKGAPRLLTSIDLDKLLLAGEKLVNASFTSASFDPNPFPFEPGKGDVWFADSPYADEFSAYSKHGFNLGCHEAQRDQARRWASNGATVIVCGSNNATSHSIYGQPTEVITLQRTVGHSKRGEATEALYVFTKK